MKKNNLVLIRKLSAAANPDVSTPNAADYTPGIDNGFVSLPVEYEIEGKLIQDIVAGESIRALRYKRNGIPVLGVFESSPVTSIENKEDRDLVATANSIYEVISLSPEDPEVISL